MTNATKLKSLNLSSSGLSRLDKGEILGQCTSLQSLDISYNLNLTRKSVANFIATLPENFALRSLNLAGVRITENRPTKKKLSGLDQKIIDNLGKFIKDNDSL